MANKNVTNYKLNLIKCLLHRLSIIIPDLNVDHPEIKSLKSIFLFNAYPDVVFDRVLWYWFRGWSKNKNKESPIKNLSFIARLVLPYVSKSKIPIFRLVKMFLTKHGINHKFSLVFVNRHNIASYLHFKDKIPDNYLSKVIY